MDKQRIARLERGRLAEAAVRVILDKLPKEKYEVFNDVPVRYGNIDHLVISREGAVFLIETKGHRGRIAIADSKILVNGKPMKRDPIAQVNRNLQWLRKRIREKLGVTVWIVSILVFTNAASISTKGHPGLNLQPIHRINVIGKGHLQRLIESYTPKTKRRMIWNRRDALLGSV